MANKKSSRREILRAGLLMGSTATAGFASRPAWAAGYPERPIKIIVPFAYSGPTDIMARILTTPLGDAIGGSIIVENKPGAGSSLAGEFSARAPRDGYTLFLGSSANIARATRPTTAAVAWGTTRQATPTTVPTSTVTPLSARTLSIAIWLASGSRRLGMNAAIPPIAKAPR